MLSEVRDGFADAVISATTEMVTPQYVYHQLAGALVALTVRKL
jgi:hypothetical protein